MPSPPRYGRRVHSPLRFHRILRDPHAHRKKVDYTKSRNLILTAVTMISGLSGATVTLGPVQLKGMGLATIVAMILSLSFLIFDRLHLSNDKK